LFGPGAGPEDGGQEPAVGVVERVVGGQDAGEHGDGVAVDVEGGLAEAGAAEEELEADITAWIQAWNDDPKPFVWTKTADQIVENLAGYLQRINNSGH
jgi:hypothetical protein